MEDIRLSTRSTHDDWRLVFQLAGLSAMAKF
jgi:hypothetical protein